MPGFGPFDSYSDALLAACPVILSKPNATAGRPGGQDFQLRWRISSEYCAWLYYTPDHKYEMSMLTDQARPNLGDRKTCNLPPFVDDPRYPPASLKYIFALHNHPFEDRLSDYDNGFFEFIPATAEMLKWIRERDDWRMERVGFVRLLANGGFFLEKG
ncbi:MAG: hypothetical protein JXB05_23060 [Myxococcaceae bacterium]|nr:hypothetical protein [Myxococcaceae bacterium]